MDKQHLSYLKLLETQLCKDGETGNKIIDKFGAIITACESQQTLSPNKENIKGVETDNFSVHLYLLNTEFARKKYGIALSMNDSTIAVSIDDELMYKNASLQLRDTIAKNNESNQPDTEHLEPLNAKPYAKRQVLFSYAWSGIKNILAVQHEFATYLENGLKSPPPPYHNVEKVTLFLDKHGFTHGESIVDQQRAMCEETPIALICYCNRYLQSKACSEEVDFYLDEKGKNHCYRRALIVPFGCEYKDLEARFTHNLAKQPNGDYLNALAFFEEANENKKQQFIQEIVVNIYQWFEENPDAPKRNSYYLAKEAFEKSNLAHLAKQPENTEPLLGALKPLDYDDAINIVDEMCNWAVNEQQGERLFYLLGDFGAGKSTTCQMLTQRLMENYRKNPDTQPVMPIYLDLKRLLNAFDNREVTGKSIEVLLETMLSTAGVDSIASGKQLVKLIHEYPCLLIFDGFDEVGQKLDPQQQVGLLNRLVEIFPNAVYQNDLKRLKKEPCETDAIPINSRIVISCRTHFFRDFESESAFTRLYDRHNVGEDGQGKQSVKNFRTFYLLPFTAKQISNYLKRWLGEEQSQQALDFIKTVHDLTELSQKPLMLDYIRQLLPDLQAQAGDAPVNVATLYQTLFNRVIHRDSEKHIIPIEEKKPLLRLFAQHLWKKGANSINADELGKWFFAHYEQCPQTKIKMNSGAFQPEVVLQDLHNASLLVRADDDNYRFAHTSFYEYFLGCYLLDTLIEGADLSVTDREVNRETLLFCSDQAEQSQQLDALKKSITDILQSKENDAPMRALAVRLWRVWDKDLSNPPANSCFDDLNLQNLKFSDGHWQEISAKNTQLNGLDVKKAHFDGVDFDDAILANSYFDLCTFSNCGGAPINAESAHLWHNDIDESSKFLFKDTPFYWKTGDTLHDRPSPIIRSQKDTLDTIFHAVLSPNKQYLLTAEGKVARLWDIKTAKYVKIFSSQNSSFDHVVFSSDNNTFLATDGDNLRIFDVRTGECLNIFEVQDEYFNSVVFSSDNQTILTTSSEGTARIFDAKTTECIKTFGSRYNEIITATFSRDNCRVLTVSRYCEIKIFDAKTAECLNNSISHQDSDDRVTCAVFSGNENIVLVIFDKGTAKVFDTTTGKCLNTFKCFSKHDNIFSHINSAIFSNDNQTISIATDNAVITFDTKTAECLKTFEPSFSNKIFLNDGDVFLVSGYDNLKAFDAETGQCLNTFESYSDGILSATFSNDNKTTLTSSFDNSCSFSYKSHAKIFDGQTGQCLNTFKGHSDSVLSAVFSDDNNTVLTASYDQTAKIFDTKTGECTKTFKGNTHTLYSAIFSNDNKKVLTRCHGNAQLFDVETQKCIKTFDAETPLPINSADFSHDDCFILITSNDNITKIFDVNTGECRVTFGEAPKEEDYLNQQHNHSAFRKKYSRYQLQAKSSDFSNDSTKILMTSNDGIKILDIKTEKYLKTFADGDSSLSKAIFSHDNRTILAISGHTVKTFNTETTECLNTFIGHYDSIHSAVFSHDDSKILTASSDGTVRTWSVETGEVLTIMHQFKDASAITDAEGNILHHDGDIWRYTIGLVEGKDGLPHVVCPNL